MDRGDTGFIIHESFKDLKARRAEQEAYRKALEEQIMQKRKLQEQERAKYEGRRVHSQTLPAPTPPQRTGEPPLPSPRIQAPEAFGGNLKQPVFNICTTHNNTPLNGQGRPTSKGRVLSFNEIDNYNEPHPAVVTPVQTQEKSVHHIAAPADIPEFSPECMKYLQQVMPGFTLPPLPIIQADHKDSKNAENGSSMARCEIDNQISMTNGLHESQNSYLENHDDQAFYSSSSGTTSESSSAEDIQIQAKAKVHVSQTSEQLEGVKISRKQYREELQKQIDERRRREDELRRKAEEEEERIQEKIRIEQAKMQREYEEELRKQEEREKEAEEKRKAALELAKQKEVAGSGKCKTKCDNSNSKLPTPHDYLDGTNKNSAMNAKQSSSEESIESIDEFFDETISPPSTKYVDPDDRIIPVVAKRLREKDLHKENWQEAESPQSVSSLTARIDSVFADPTMAAPKDLVEPPQPGLLREMAIRSAPCPPTTNPNDLDFLCSLKNYLQNEKNKMDERIQARFSKSTEKF